MFLKQFMMDYVAMQKIECKTVKLYQRYEEGNYTLPNLTTAL